MKIDLPYEVLLANKGDPRLGQNPDRHILGTPKPVWLPADSFDTAARYCTAYIKKHSLAPANWAGGRIRDKDRQTVAQVDFDGRVREHGSAPAPR